MNYEKKYKDALERASQAYIASRCGAFDEALLESIFPELLESNDERIRKWLVELVENQIPEVFVEVAKPAVIDYLEKQKVLPGFDELTPEEKMNHPLYLEGFDVGRDVQKVFDEQKPAEWSEDSVKFEEGFKAGRESGLRDGQKYVLNNLDSYGLCRVGGK